MVPCGMISALLASIALSAPSGGATVSTPHYGLVAHSENFPDTQIKINSEGLLNINEGPYLDFTLDSQGHLFSYPSALSQTLQGLNVVGVNLAIAGASTNLVTLDHSRLFLNGSQPFGVCLDDGLLRYHSNADCHRFVGVGLRAETDDGTDISNQVIGAK